MNDDKDLTPPLLEGSINEMEFMIEGAKEDYLTNQWICTFIGRPLFGLQLWRASNLSMEIKGHKSPGLVEGLEEFVRELESCIPIYKIMIKNLAIRMEANND
jgi:hypothetical protein